MAKEIKLAYVPHPKQQLFHNDCALNRYVLFLAGVGTGKTLAGCHEIIYSALRNPGKDGAIVSPTFAMLKNVIMPQWREWIPKQLYEERRKEQQILLWTGQTIFLLSAERPDAARGLNLAFAWLDEPASMRNPEMDDVIASRVGRTTEIKHPVTFYTTTPKGWNWLAQKFLRDPKPGEVTIRARSHDNPKISPQLLADLKDKYTEEFYNQEVLAEVTAQSGIVWPLDHKVHVFSDRTILQDRKRFKKIVGAIDWGWNVPTSLLVLAQETDGTWWVLEEWYQRPKDYREVEQAIRDMHRRWKVQYWWADSAEPERINNVNAIGVRCLPVKKRPGSVNQGIQEVAGLLTIKHSGKPGLFIHHSCKKLLLEASYYHYDREKERAIGDKGDHACDALRYAITMENYDIKLRGWI